MDPYCVMHTYRPDNYPTNLFFGRQSRSTKNPFLHSLVPPKVGLFRGSAFTPMKLSDIQPHVVN